MNRHKNDRKDRRKNQGNQQNESFYTNSNSHNQAKNSQDFKQMSGQTGNSILSQEENLNKTSLNNFEKFDKGNENNFSNQNHRNDYKKSFGGNYKNNQSEGFSSGPGYQSFPPPQAQAQAQMLPMNPSSDFPSRGFGYNSYQDSPSKSNGGYQSSKNKRGQNGRRNPGNNQNHQNLQNLSSKPQDLPEESPIQPSSKKRRNNANMAVTNHDIFTVRYSADKYVNLA